MNDTTHQELVSGTVSDPLMQALVTITRIHHRPFSAESLGAGLPLEAGMLTPALFVRAADRAGFSARYLKRALHDITELVLPVVLILKDGNTCVLVEKSDEAMRVIFPDEQENTHQLSADALAERYSGECLFVKPEFNSEDQQDKPIKGHWFWDTIKRSRSLYGEVLLASFMINLFALVTPLFIMNVYDRVVPNYALDTLWVLASGVVIVFVFDLTLKSLRGYFIDAAGKRADIILSSSTFARVMDLKLSQRPGRVGSFANNLQEFDSFREFFTSTTLITLIDLPFVILFILLIYGVGGVLAVVPATAIPLIVITGLIVQKPLQKIINATFTESARKHAMLIETLTALDAVKGARAEGVMQRRWEEFNARIAKLGLRSRLLSLTTVNVAQLIQQLSTVAVVILGVYAITLGDLSIGGLIACTILTGRCLAPMSQVASILTRYHHSMAAYSAIDRIMSMPVERPAGRTFLHRPVINGDIEFKGVSFSYPEQQIPALRDISLHIREGEKVAIIGRTGSGKSTLQRLIMNFYEPAEGAILINGTDLNQIDPTDLRRNISYVPQDVLLFNGSVRENIVLGAPLSTDESVLSAVEMAGMAEYLNQHPQGYDLPVGERGANLSGGQRQGIAIARALVDKAPILLFDEPTNGMDSTTELVLKNKLEGYLQDRTLLLVTHKASMLSLVDRLLVLNDGQIVADGPKEEVLKALAGAPP
jgi:ATP-binding cassette, subfamily C, bacterial LapB